MSLAHGRNGFEQLTRRELVRGALAGGVALGAGGLLAACGSSASTSASSLSASQIKRGGTLTVGLSGGSTSDTIDAQNPNPDTDDGRIRALYEPLAVRDQDYKFEYLLAESIEPTYSHRLDNWTIRLKPGILFHDGSPVTADAVIYSILRILNPKAPKDGVAFISYIDAKAMKKVDSRTVQVPLHIPNFNFPDDLGQYFNTIVPVDYNLHNPIGTGPWKFKSFTPGQRSVFTRWEHYWRTPANFDELVILDLSDDTARLNALISGQVDAISNVPNSELPTVQQNQNLKALISIDGNFQPITMRVDREPFTDVRVRQAFKLIVNRRQMVEQALAGQGQPANDIPGRWDPLYDHSIPQRVQDLEQAKSLLKAAGRSDLSIELLTAPFYAHVVEAAQVFAQQAKGAGVNVNVKTVDVGTFFGPTYLKATFSQDFWVTRSLLGQIAFEYLPNASYNETHWNDVQFNALVVDAQGATDETKREEYMHELQRVMWADSGVLIHTFTNQLDGYKSDLVGFRPSKNGSPLSDYDFRVVGRV